MAVQGGLLATSIAQRKGSAKGVILAFLIPKIFAYTLLGGALGYFGSLFQLTIQIQAILQIFAGLFMLAVVGNLLDIHPIFRYMVLQPPKFVTRLVRDEAKSQAFFAPAFLGASTILIPCGTTQAMMVLAIASGNPIAGALTMFLFTLGTVPLFAGLAFGFARLGSLFQASFAKVAAFSIFILAIFNLNNGIALSGSSLTLDKAWTGIWCTVSFCETSPMFANAQTVVDEATITIQGNGYSPGNFSVKRGSSIKLNLVNKSGGGCTQSFTIPSLGIQKIVPLGNSDTVSFTAPSKPGDLAFMCGMGMFRGTIRVI